MMHPDVYVAQTTCAHPNHFYKAVLEANEFQGPAIVNVFTTCQPEHGVADNMAEHQAKLAVDSRSFPLFIYDPRKGARFKERLSLVGNPNVKDDWYVNPKTGEQIDFIDFARSEGRFAKHFDKDGNPSATLLAAKQDRLENWHLLQELAGIAVDRRLRGLCRESKEARNDPGRSRVAGRDTAHSRLRGLSRNSGGPTRILPGRVGYRRRFLPPVGAESSGK